MISNPYVVTTHYPPKPPPPQPAITARACARGDAGKKHLNHRRRLLLGKPAPESEPASRHLLAPPPTPDDTLKSDHAAAGGQVAGGLSFGEPPSRDRAARVVPREGRAARGAAANGGLESDDPTPEGLFLNGCVHALVGG